LLKIRTCGTKWKRAIDKIDEWATWQWANAKINKETFSFFKQIVHISMRRLNEEREGEEEAIQSKRAKKNQH
jgi:hypothetical protein